MFHSKRVSKICEQIAIETNFDKDGVDQMRIDGLMHDIGKIGIDEKVLEYDILNNEEWSDVKRHVEIGNRILASVNEIIRCSDSQFDPVVAKIFVENVLGKTWEGTVN